jgi:hypothetical protein
MSDILSQTMNRTAPNIAVAAKQANLTPEEMDQLGGAVFIMKKHRELLSLDESKARFEYEKLDKQIQQGITSMFGQDKPDYLTAKPTGIFQRAWYTIKEEVFEPAGGALRAFSQAITTPYRAARQAAVYDDIDFDWETIKASYDGETVFDRDRLAKVQNYYDTDVFNLAKKMSLGKTFSEILPNIKTEAEFEIMAELITGGPRAKQIQEAINDLSDAKVSLGRDVFYGLLDVDPGERGANKKAFDVLSGTVDLASQIVFDPVTYIAAPIKVYQSVFLNIGKLAIKDGDDFLVRAINRKTILGNESGVSRALNAIGEDVKKFKIGDEATKTEALARITRFFPEIDEKGVVELAKREIYNAQDFGKYIADMADLEKILKARPGQPDKLLPSYGIIRENRLALRNWIGQNLFKLPTAGTTNANFDLLDAIGKGGDEAVLQQVADTRSLTDKARRWTERTVRVKSVINVGGPGWEREAKTIYGLARMANLSRIDAQFLAQRWVTSGDNVGQRYAMVSGLYKTIGYRMGVHNAEGGRELIERGIGKSFFDEQYSEIVPVDDVMRKLLGDEIGNNVAGVNLAVVGQGGEKATLPYQLSNLVRLPDFTAWQRASIGKNATLAETLGRQSDKVFNNSFSEFAVNLWSWFVLIPRLGIRSSIEEVLYYGLAAPVSGLHNYFKGVKTSQRLRYMEDLAAGRDMSVLPKMGTGEMRRTGTFNRLIHRKMKNHLNADELADLQKNGQKSAVMAKYLGLAYARSKGKVPGATDDFLVDFFDYAPHPRGDLESVNTSIADPYIVRGGQEGVQYGKNVSVRDIISGTNRKQFKFQNKITRISRWNNESFFASYVDRLESVVDDIADNTIAQIALRNINNPEAAVAEIASYLVESGLMKQFALSTTNDATTLASKQFLIIRNLVVREDRTVNTKLLNMMRKEDGTFSAKDLDLEDMAKAFEPEDLPAEILGKETISIVRNNEEAMFKTFRDASYGWMDRQIQTLSREPIFFANYQMFRKKLAPLEKQRYEKMYQVYLKGGKTADEAAALAKRDAKKFAVNAAVERSYAKTIGYVDNPLVRSNFAFTVRNFARFFRATEDFYRRVGRLARYSPEALVKIRIASEGLDHSGFIHENEDGEKYFVFPGDEIINTVAGGAIKALTGEDVKIPVPLSFSGKIKMLSPGIDPEAAIPTISGPLSAITLKALATGLGVTSNLTGKDEFRDLGDFMTGIAVGPKGQAQSLYQIMVPPQVRRALSVLSTDERNSEWASAARKAAIVYAGNGLVPGEDASAQEIEDYRKNIAIGARNVIALRFFLGLFSPVSPQIDMGTPGASLGNSDVNLRELGVVNFKQAFFDMLNEYAGDPDGYNKALTQWSKLNPNLLAYTVSETEVSQVATVRKTKQAAEYVKDNRELFKKYPEGAAFFIPFGGDYDPDAYRFLKNEGFTDAKPVEQFLKEVAVAKDYSTYMNESRAYKEKLALYTTPEIRQRLTANWETFKNEFLDKRPLLMEELSSFSNSDAKRALALNDLRAMVSDPKVPNSDLKKVLKDMIDIYTKASLSRDAITGQTEAERNLRDNIASDAYTRIQNISTKHPEAEGALLVLFKPLLGL